MKSIPLIKRPLVETDVCGTLFRLNTPEDFAIAVWDDENEPRDSFDIAPVRRFNCFLIGHIYAGKGRIYWPQLKRMQNLKPGSVIIVPPGELNLYGGIPESGYMEDYACFVGKDAEAMYKCGLLRSGCYSFEKTRFLPGIKKKFSSPFPEIREKAWIEFFNILLEFNNPTAGYWAPDRFKMLMQELNAHPELWWSVDDMSRFCDCSGGKLRREFLSRTGMLPKQYVEKIKLEKAAEKLVSTGDDINKICVSLGYRDRFHFSRRFSDFFGLPPGKFRLNAISRKEND